jgi:23S rRNA pseudouridine1911/1915/1917 synthase
MIKNKDFSKKYLAVVRGILDKKEDELVDYLLKEEDGNTIVTTKEKGKLSKLKYKVLEENKSNNLSLLEIELLTGRHHQIRVQFASRGHSLYGDQRYGKQDKEQIALWAYKLSFMHPVKKENVSFTYFPPNEGIWINFNNQIQNSSCK